jgi:hypothetical protein
MAKAKREQDVVLLAGATKDGKGIHVLRAREDRIEAGEVRPVKEGQAITGELVKLTPRDESPELCDVEVLHAPAAPKPGKPAEGATRHGPAQVATKAYRDQWTRVFGGTDEGPPSSRQLN